MAVTARTDAATWAIAVAGGIFLAGLTTSLFRFQPTFLPLAAADSAPGLTSISLRPTPPADADFRDPTTLYLPNRWSAMPAARSIDAIQRPGDTLLRPYDRKLSLGSSVRIDFPSSTPVPEKPVDVLGVSLPVAPFAGFGRTGAVARPAADRVALIQAYALTDGKLVFKRTVSSDSPPAGDWNSLEFTATVGPAGLIGLPFLTASSGSPAVDTHFRDYLENKLRIGAILDAGTYRIRIEP